MLDLRAKIEHCERKINHTITTVVSTLMDAALDILKQTIADGKQEERQQGTMMGYIQHNLSSLHQAIAIHSSSPESALIHFIEDYVDSVPEHIQALYTIANQAQLSAYVQHFLDLCCTYFVKPPELLASFTGLQGLLNKAYLAHRLMEELNDQVMSLSGGVALAPMDMSMANIICHSLIGDTIANQLDHLVLLTIETSTADKTIFQQQNIISLLEKRRLIGWSEVTERWPCFTKDCAIHLQITP